MDKDNNNIVSSLREKALDFLDGAEPDLESLSESEIKGLIQELQIRQVELKMQNEELRQSQELQFDINKTITDNAASCLFMMDKNGHPTFMNPAAEEVCGYTLEEIQDKPLHDAIHNKYPDGRPYPMSECPIDNAQAELQVMKNYEDIFVRKDGSLFPVICYIAPLEQKDEVVGAVLEFRDVTEQKQADGIKTSLKEKEVLLQEIHHRVKNNFQVIASLLLLQSSSLTNKEAIQSLTDAHGRILAMARVHEHLYRSENLDKINGKEYLGGIIEDWISISDSISKDISYEYELEEIIFDQDQAISCGQIVAELLSNADKHAFPNNRSGTVHISLQRQDGKIEIIVMDDGVGMPENFDPQQTDTLGLQLVNGYTIKLGGELIINSEGHTRVSIVFPETST